jgi:hypothetical protein
LKQQLKHSEKNLIDLEDTSDFDNESDMTSDEEIQIDGMKFNMKKDKSGLRHDMEDPISALDVLKNVNKAYFNRPSVQKKRQLRKQAALVAAYMGTPGKGGFSTSKIPLT